MIQLNVNIRGNPGVDPVEYVIDNKHRYAGVLDVPGRMVFRTTQVEPSPYGSHIEWRGKILAYLLVPPDGFVGEVAGGACQMVPQSLTFDPPPPILRPLHADGWALRDDQGHRYIHNQATNFLLFQRYLEGQDTEPLLYDGFDGYRVFFTAKNVSEQAGLRHLRPENYGDFFVAVDAFLSWVERKGKRIEVTLLCDCAELGLDLAWQRRFTERMYEILRASPVHLVELGNEVEQNGVYWRELQQPAGLCWSRGSSLAGGPCPLPPGTYSTFHLTRGSGGGSYTDACPIEMITGYPGYAGVHGPVITNETKGASDTENSDRRTADADYFYRIAATMRGWSGGTFHADFGTHSDPCVPGSVQDQCRAAFVQGITGASR